MTDQFLHRVKKKEEYLSLKKKEGWLSLLILIYVMSLKRSKALERLFVHKELVRFGQKNLVKV